MKTLKLIVLMLLTANFIAAQDNTFYGTGAGDLGTYNSNFGMKAGENAGGQNNSFIGVFSGRNAVTASNSIGVGYGALNNGVGAHNVAVGVNAGKFAFKNSVFVGGLSGEFVESQNNTVIGYAALRGSDIARVTGSNNIAVGHFAGNVNTSGGDNVFMGPYAGQLNTTGSGNMFLGNAAGGNNVSGNRNVAIGKSAGATNNGSGNIFIGYEAGADALLANVSNQLYIQNSTDITNPLIYGDFASGNVGINIGNIPLDSDNNPYTLAVNGKTITEEVQVMLSDSWWPDYVFAEDYDLMPLTDLEAEIATLGHLPGVPSAEEVEANGHALGRMDAILLEKVEELTLHLIDMNKEMEKLRERNETLETRLSEVEDK